MSGRKSTVPLADLLLLTPREAAALLGVNYHYVLHLVTLGPTRGGLASVPVGSQRRIPRKELDVWITNQQGGMS